MPADDVGDRRLDKRQKHSRACEFCRRRKVGCDAADRSGHCSMCAAQGIECEYDPTSKMKRPTKNLVTSHFGTCPRRETEKQRERRGRVPKCLMNFGEKCGGLPWPKLHGLVAQPRDDVSLQGSRARSVVAEKRAFPQRGRPLERFPRSFG
ncbi:hypothetical protein V8D89_003190 [Ganoderma adspersum]